MTDKALLQQAIEQVDGCMCETQVEPEDAAAWQVIRKYIDLTEVAPGWHYTDNHRDTGQDAAVKAIKRLAQERDAAMGELADMKTRVQESVR